MTHRQIHTAISLLLSVMFVSAVYPVLSKVYGAPFRVDGQNTVIDQAGRQVTVTKPFARIISLYGAHTENLFRLGLDEEVIGVSRHETYPPRALQVPVFSYHDDPEKFLAARPDLVIIRPMIDRGYPQLVSLLEKNGITIISLQPATVEDMFTYWKILGLLGARQLQAAQMIARFKAAAAAFRALTKCRIVRKRVYFEAIHSKMKTFAPDSMAVFALEAAGGINVASDAASVRRTNIAYFGKERILSRAREIDVYLAQSGAMNQPSVKLIAEEPGFKTIKAVAGHEIYIIDEQIVSRPTMRLLDGIYHIGNILYPEDYNHKALAILEQANKPW